MDFITQLLNLAAQTAAKKNSIDKRSFRLGAVGIRSDGAITTSRNASSYDRFPQGHAEVRLSRKLDLGAIVFVARITRDGNWALARPCGNCMRTLIKRGVKRICYTIGPNEYGVINL